MLTSYAVVVTLNLALAAQLSAQQYNLQSLASPQNPATTEAAFSDSYEGTALSPFWTVHDIVSGDTVGLSTDYARTGSSSLKFTSQYGHNRWFYVGHTFPSPVRGTFTIYFYDVTAGSATVYQYLRLGNSTNGNVAGVGVDDWEPSCYKASISNGLGAYWAQYPWPNPCAFNDSGTTDNTNLPRTVGWHRFDIETTSVSTILKIDGQTLVTGPAFSFDMVWVTHVAPYWRPSGVGYWDDFSFTPEAQGDTTPPAIVPMIAGTQGNNGWYTSNVTVSWTITDGESSVTSRSGCDPVTLSAETAGTALTCSATSAGGSASQSVTIKIDKTPPGVAFGVPSPAPNPSGWNKTAVSISFTASDLISGVASTAPTSPLDLTAEGAAVSGVVTVTDAAGNTATVTSPAVKVDRTPPTLAGLSSPSPNAAGWNNTDVLVTFLCTDGLSGVAFSSPAARVSAEGAAQSASGSCADGAGNTSNVSVTGISIDKTPPAVTSPTITPAVVPINTGASVSAQVSDGGSGLSGANYTVSSGAAGALQIQGGAATAALPTFTSTGVYNVCVRATDAAGNTSTEQCVLLPVYDPNGGFVTGGGWINSPLGAYAPDPALTGKATFGFVSKYQNGATVPTGDTQFQFQVANLKFKSTSYEWLVIAGAKAQYKGAGTINGAGDYGFMLTAIDGDVNGGGDVDKFRIKIWGANGIVYDNQMGTGDNDEPTTALGGGSIVIHK